MSEERRRGGSFFYQNYTYICLKLLAMDTLIIKIRDRKAIKLIQDLELLNLIQIIPPAIKTASKLSDKMQGSLSKEQAADYYEQIDTLKDEWERATY